MDSSEDITVDKLYDLSRVRITDCRVEAAVVDARPTAVDGDGYRYDSASGEVIGHMEALSADEAPEDAFAIRTAEAADWVLEKMAYEEAQLVKIETLRAAQLANLDAMMVEPRNRLAWLHRRFDGELVAQAQRDLAAAGGRSKTAKYLHGRVACRRTAGSAEIHDQHAAVEFVAEWAPDHVRRSVGIEGVRAAIAAETDAVEDVELRIDTARFFRAAEPAERWTIDTGIGAGKGGTP